MLTVVRLVCVPVTVVLISHSHMIWALIVFVFACGTDLLDGYIARKYNLTTKLGIWLDPFADKLMAIAVIITFTACNIIPLWVIIVLFAKELIMLTGGFILLKRGVSTPSNKFGKIAAFLLNVAIGTGFFFEYWAPYYLYIIYTALLLSVLAMVQYGIKNLHLFQESKQNITEGKERKQ